MVNDKLSKVRAEIERLIEQTKTYLGACAGQVVAEANNKIAAYNEVLGILDTMQEEPTAKIRGWVARQPEGELWLFAESPYYNSSLGSWGTAIGGERVLEGINTTMFKDLNFYDEPIEVELIIRKV